ncbi:hypothetical protein RB7881 [Rhodopirellula baltica SH 1]|uniref:Uncharacterized protein n=1 Tax=Rhodopirellula baltica (strain DSM 10527 / NCIMB 13988 / SH1) TaxID=243090 RepID=Q7UMZ4_RHOBA|nr:hypothetical protein RB7881 [Rhodopirellula baltica SH 1]
MMRGGWAVVAVGVFMAPTYRARPASHQDHRSVNRQIDWFSRERKRFAGTAGKFFAIGRVARIVEVLFAVCGIAAR